MQTTKAVNFSAQDFEQLTAKINQWLEIESKSKATYTVEIKTLSHCVTTHKDDVVFTAVVVFEYTRII